MLTDGWHLNIKQYAHSFLGTPNSLILVINLNTLFLTFYLEYQELSCAIRISLRFVICLYFVKQRVQLMVMSLSIE